MKYLAVLLVLFSSTLSAQVVVNGNPPDSEPNKFYSTTFTATGGTAPYTYFVTNPPDFLSMDQNAGVLSGTVQSPVIGNSYTFTVTAVDATMAQGQSQYSITVETSGKSSKDGNGGGCVVTQSAGLRWLSFNLLLLIVWLRRKLSAVTVSPSLSGRSP